MINYFKTPDRLVDAVKAVLSGKGNEYAQELLNKDSVDETNKNDDSDDGEGLDAVQPKAVKKKFKDRKDKDIDNDGDTDDSDEYLHKRRKAISKKIKDDVKEDKEDKEEEDEPDPEPKDDNGEDKKKKKKAKKENGKKDEVDTEPQFDDNKQLPAEQKEEVELDEAVGKNVITVSGISDIKKADAERLKNVGENILSNLEDLGVANIFDKNIKYKGNLIIIDSDDEDVKLLEKWVKNQNKLATNTLKMIKGFPSGSDARVQYVKLYDNQKADHLYVAALLNNTAKANKAPKYSHKFMKEEVELTEREISSTEKKKKEDIVMGMKKRMPDFEKKYGDRAKDVMYATATKMAMKEGLELTEIDISVIICEDHIEEGAMKRGADLKTFSKKPKTMLVVKKGTQTVTRVPVDHGKEMMRKGTHLEAESVEHDLDEDSKAGKYKRGETIVTGQWSDSWGREYVIPNVDRAGVKISASGVSFKIEKL